jgi:peroxin-5
VKGKNDKDEKIFKQTAMCIMSSLVGNYERASMALQTIAEDTPDWITLNRLGASLANGGNYEEALATYSRIPLENQCPRVLYNRGIALMCTDKLSESKSVFIKALIELSRHDTIEGSIIWDALELASELSGDSLVSGFVAAKDINNLMMIENLSD